MMMKTPLALLLIFATCYISNIQAQTYPVGYRQPLDLSPDVSGSYCEMRSHHFHAGMDFRTLRKQGFNVYAVSDGYIKRIKISHYGYGKLIQVQHKDGYVSHYGHLSKYAAPIDAYVKNLQYKEQSYEIEIFPEPGALPVYQGQVIAYSGNTGGSQGPHLHFEIRDSTNTWVYNPLLFGIKMLDTKKPQLKNLRLYTGDADPVTLVIKKSKSGNYYISNLSSIYAKDFLKLAFDATDPQDGSGFKNGIYHAQLFIDDNLGFEYKMDKIKIDDLRSIDEHIDYEYWVKNGTYFEKLWYNKSNPLPIYTQGAKDYTKELSTGEHTVKIKLTDFSKNSTEFSFKIHFTAEEPSMGTGSGPYIAYNKDAVISDAKGILQVKIPAYTLFADIKKETPPTIAANLNAFGEVDFTIGNKYIALHNAFRVEVKTNHTKVSIDKLCIVYHQKEGKMRYYGQVFHQGDKIVAEVKDLGNFSVWADTTAPVIKKMNIRDSMYVYYKDTIETYATDDLSDIVKYHAYIDGVWHLTEYEYKDNLLFTPLPEGLAPGPHTFEIQVQDDRKNKVYRKLTIFITNNKNDLLLNKKK